MPNIYQTVFGGNPVAPAIPTYLALSFSVNTILGWPLESNITSPAVAEWIDCTATAGSLTLQLSDARQVSTGYTAIFNNAGANTFSVLDAQGNTLMAPASGAAWILVLTDNSTLQGTWRALQLGAGTSVANAAALAGNGLKAISTTLNERIFLNPQGSNYTILTTDRASCIEWTGGSGGTFTSPNPATAGSDWFCYIKNSGTGVLTFTPASGTVDGSANKTFNPNDSCIIVCDGTNFFSMGFGQSVASSFNFVTISLAGASGTVVLTGAQLNRISYKFTGALAGNTVVQVPASIQQYWIDNETTGAFTLTISAGGAGTTFTVPQANRTILYCDGLNIVNAISSGSIQFADGTAAAPSITFASDLTLGFYKAGADILGISTAGVQRGVVNASGQWTINAPSSGAAATINGAASTHAVVVNGSSTSGQSYGLEVFAGTNASDRALSLVNQAGTVNLGIVFGDGHFQLGWNGSNPTITGAAAGNVTINAPTAGQTLVLNTVAGAYGFAVTATAGNYAALSLAGNGNAINGANDFGIYQLQTSDGYIDLHGNHTLHILTNAVDRIDVSGSGNVTINAPGSGPNLTLTGASGNNQPFTVNGGGNGASSTSEVGINRAGSTANAIGAGPGVSIEDTTAVTATTLQHSGGQTELWQYNGAWVQILKVGTTHGITINAAANGVTSLTVTGAAGGVTAQTINGGGAAGVNFGALIQAGTSSTDYSLSVANNTGATTYFKVRGDGLVLLPGGIQPAFYATENAGQSLPSGATTTLIFNTSQFIQDSVYNTGTGVFTAPVAGLYLVCANVWLQNNAAGSATCSMWFSVTGSVAGTNQIIPVGFTFNPSSQPNIFPASFVMKLSANDTVQIKATVGTNNLQHGSAGSNQSSFCAYLLG